MSTRIRIYSTGDQEPTCQVRLWHRDRSAKDRSYRLYRDRDLQCHFLQAYFCWVSAEKNDIIDVIVTEIGETWIKGKIGHAQVLIPRSKMPETECEYRANENVYIFRDELKIDK